MSNPYFKSIIRILRSQFFHNKRSPISFRNNFEMWHMKFSPAKLQFSTYTDAFFLYLTQNCYILSCLHKLDKVRTTEKKLICTDYMEFPHRFYVNHLSYQHLSNLKIIFLFIQKIYKKINIIKNPVKINNRLDKGTEIIRKINSY